MKPAAIDSRAGTYALLYHLGEYRQLDVGRLGRFGFRPGYYLYVGSALGPGGLKSRIARHLKQAKSRHWHIDYIGGRMDPIEIWYQYGNTRRECRWAACISKTPWIDRPVPGFGSSDCTCPAHLFYGPKRIRCEAVLKRFEVRIGCAV